VLIDYIYLLSILFFNPTIEEKNIGIGLFARCKIAEKREKKLLRVLMSHDRDACANLQKPQPCSL
jgi:thioredoxin-related protein